MRFESIKKEDGGKNMDLGTAVTSLRLALFIKSLYFHPENLDL